MSRGRSHSSAVVIAAAIALIGGLTDCVRAADPAFVGSLALAVDEEGVRRLGLSDETRQKLLELIDRREQEAVSLALSIKDLPPGERSLRLAPFVKESERQGLALLTLEQRAVLEQMHTARSGMGSLGQANVAQILGLNADQQAKIQKLLAERAEAMSRGTDDERRLAREKYERELASLLTGEQRANWERLAGLAPGIAPAAAPQVAAPPAAAPQATTPPAATPPADGPPAPVPPQTEPPQPQMPATTAPEAPTTPAEPATVPQVDANAAPSPNDTLVPTQPGDVKLRFNFQHQPWSDVLTWFAAQADLSLQMDAAPAGTFNYRDNKEYTPAEALDLMNSVLLTKGYTLVRHERLLLLVNLEDTIPPQLVELVSPTDLDARGDFELLKCLFRLVKLDTTEAQEEISQLVGPQGSIVALPKSGQLLVTETAGRLRTIRSVLESVENPDGSSSQGIVEIALKHVGVEELLSIARPLLGLGDEQNANETIRISVDPFGARLFVTGRRDALQQLQDIATKIDRAPEGTAATAVVEQPQLETYGIGEADPASVLAVMQTLLAGLPDVRLTIDPATNNLIALARPAEHRTITATLKQLEGATENVEVIQLRKMDPQLVILTISKLFASGDTSKNAKPSGPKVDGDPTTRKLWVRGSAAEIQQVRELVEKLEGTDPALGGTVGDNMRVLPFSGSTAQKALENAQLLWPALRANRIRIVTPSAISPTLQEGERSGFPRSVLPQRVPAGPVPAEESESPDRPATPPANAPVEQKSAGRTTLTVPVRLAVWNEEPAVTTPADSSAAPPTEPPATPAPAPTPAAPAAAAPTSAPPAAAPVPVTPVPVTPAPVTPAPESPVPAAAPSAPTDPAPNMNEPPSTAEPQLPAGPPSDIIITQTPSGLVIASQDRQALDDFEELLRSLLEQAAQSPTEPTIFWLKYAKADVAAEILNQILSGTSASGTGGSLVGDVAQSVLGSVGGGIIGSILGGGGDGGVLSGTASIVPDIRLNALVVQAPPAELVLIEQLLQVIDREASPEEVQTGGKPRLIPVIYMPAEEMAEIVKQVYADRIAGNEARSQRPPSPEDFIRALRGGGRDGSRNQTSGEVQKMTIGVDARSNSLIVAAPEPLFKDVEALVAQLDDESIVTDESVQIISVKQANPELIQKALASIVGQSATTSNRSGSSSSRSSTSTPGGPPGGSSAEDIQRRIEFFRSLRERMGGGGGPPGFGGPGFGGPGGFGGFGGPGGFQPQGDSGRGSSSPRGGSSRSSRGRGR